MAKNRKMYSLCVLMVFIMIFCGLLVQELSAKKMDRGVPLKGNWTEGPRSVSPVVPISVTVNEDLLSVQSSSQRSDITISISKDGAILYKEIFLASDSECIVIDLDDFDSGEYVIELSNQWGGSLRGEMTIL